MSDQPNEIKIPTVTHEMLSQKIEELMSSANQLQGSDIGRAYHIISSISKEPYRLRVDYPVHIVPDWRDLDRELGVVGPNPVPSKSGVEPDIASPLPVVLEHTPYIAFEQNSTHHQATVQCPNCSHELKITIKL